MRIISAIDWGGFLEGFEDADGEAAQAGDVFRAEAGADATAVLIEVPVDEIMKTGTSMYVQSAYMGGQEKII